MAKATRSERLLFPLLAAATLHGAVFWHLAGSKTSRYQHPPLAQNAPVELSFAAPTGGADAPETARASSPATESQRVSHRSRPWKHDKRALASVEPGAPSQKTAIAAPAADPSPSSEEADGSGASTGDTDRAHGGLEPPNVTATAPSAPVGALAHGPRLLASKSCTDLFAGELDHPAVAVVHVDAAGSARLAALLEPDASDALARASARCVERLAFEPARDGAGSATSGTAKLRLRLAREATLARKG